ncbi:hypothetical protein V2J09_024315 [Rumex salicifolius]
MSDLVGKAKNFVAEKIAEIPKPDANLEDVKIKGIARNGITYHAMVGVKNPYPHSISICELVYSLKCGGRLVLSGNMPDPGSMPGNNTTTTLEMPMLVPHDVLVTLTKDVLKGWDIDYELDVGLVMDLPVVVEKNEENETSFLHLNFLSMSNPTTVLPILPSAFTAPPPPPPPTSVVHSLSSLGLGYAIAIALGFLVILSSLLILSYLCRRRSHQTPQYPIAASTNSGGGVMLPSIIFVAEDGSPNHPDSPTGVVGLDPSVINSYPKFQFSRSEMNSESTACSICLCDYKEEEMLRMMPDCRHSFHLYCLDAWLRLNGSCPVCRNSPLPTPLSTPLAEVVPLTQFADSRRRR